LPRPALAKEAYIYGFSPVDNYRVRYAYFAAGKSKEFKAPGNRLANVLRVYTPENKACRPDGVLARGKGGPRDRSRDLPGPSSSLFGSLFAGVGAARRKGV
jgi:hypothetical protein